MGSLIQTSVPVNSLAQVPSARQVSGPDNCALFSKLRLRIDEPPRRSRPPAAMSLLSGILQSQAPAKQDATTTIQTLCLRLTSSTLLEDRRAAILSLRSFAREYKELVASGGLRGLIQTLAHDSEDADTTKVVLETLLLLFVKDEVNVSEPEYQRWAQRGREVTAVWESRVVEGGRGVAGMDDGWAD